MGCGIDDEWLQKKIEEDLNAMADEREKQLMEMHELQNIQMPREKLEDIYREAERRRKVVRKKKIRYRMVAALAATLVLCVGAGVISSGNKVYVPEIFQSSRGDEVQTKIENSDSIYSEYDEEEICQEIEEELGVIAVRFGYRSNGMYLFEYQIFLNQVSFPDISYSGSLFDSGDDRVPPTPLPHFSIVSEKNLPDSKVEIT